MRVQDVLTAVRWQFAGGSFDEVAGPRAISHDPVRFPSTSSAHLAALIASGEESHSEVRALQRILTIRRRERSPALRTLAGWAVSWYALRHLREVVLMEPDMPVYSGLRSVYMLVSALLDRPRNRRTLNPALQAYVKEMMMCTGSASNMDIPTMADRVTEALRVLSDSRFPDYHELLTGFDAVFRATRRASARSRARRVGMSLLKDPDDARYTFEMSSFASPMVFSGIRVYACYGMALCNIGSSVLCMTTSDMGRVHQLLSSLTSGLLATSAQVVFSATITGADQVAETYHDQAVDMLSWATLVPLGREVLVCKAAKRAYGAFLGELAGPLCREETAALWQEADETAPRRINPDRLRAYIARARRFAVETALNLAKMYKVCPAPDACPGMTMLDRYAVVTRPNTADDVMVSKLMVEYRDQMLRAYIRGQRDPLPVRPGVTEPRWYQAYRARRYDDIPTTDIHRVLSWEGTAKMPHRSPANPSNWKDSGLGWDTVDVANDPARPKRHANMLLRMVFDPKCPMPGTRHMSNVHHHKEDTKPEGHKDPARGIYSGNIKDRLDCSWMEVAVERVATHHPAYMIGASTVDRDIKLRALLDRPTTRATVAVYYSFDISGWSPKMCGAVQRGTHAFWAALYNEDLFRWAHTVNERALVYMNKAGYQCSYVNPEANFEGYNGKEMTCLLISLLSLSVREWRNDVVAAGMATEEQVERYSALLFAYIDDGLARLDLPRAAAVDLFERFKVVTIRTFARCGFEIETSKCYPSDRFCIFLNEIYLAGRHVVHGTRAAMTLCSESVEAHTTIIERSESVAAGCRGAVSAGLNPATAAFLMTYHLYKHLDEWSLMANPVAAAVWSMCPRAWGGLGVPTMMQLGTAGSGTAFAEGVFALQRYASIQPAARRLYIACARSGLKKRTASATLAAPLGGTIGTGVMVPSRVPAAVRDALRFHMRAGVISPLAREFLSYASHDDLEAYAASVLALGQPHVVQKKVLDDIAAVHPHHLFVMFAKRLDKSSTLSQLISQKKMARLIKDNHADAAESLECMVRRMMMSA